MTFDAESLRSFLGDIPFYKNADCYCLGNSLAEAGEIVRQIADAKDRKECKNVELDIK